MFLLTEMEVVPVTRRRFQLRDLFQPDFAVPTTDLPGAGTQPGVDRGSRHRTRFFKNTPHVSLQTVESNGSASDTFSSNTLQLPPCMQNPDPSRDNAGLTIDAETNRALPAIQSVLPTVPTRDPSIWVEPPVCPDVITVNSPITTFKLLFRKHVRLPRNRINLDHPPVQGRTTPAATRTEPVLPTIVAPEPVSSIPEVRVTPPSVYSTQDIDSTTGDQEAAASPEPSSSVLATTCALESSIPSPPCPLPIPVLATPHTHVTDAHTLGETQRAETAEDSLPLDGRWTTVMEHTNSTKLHSPEKGVYVGKLYELPPPERLQTEWRESLRAQLTTNLYPVIMSLSPSLSRAEKTIEFEFCMSGKLVQRGPGKVTLRPTIWIRCGSKQCQKAVQSAMEDLDHLYQFPIHVTRHAPRPAGVVPSPLHLIGGTDLLPKDLTDAILSVRPEQSSTTTSANCSTQSIGNSTLNIQVQSLHENRFSACGLQVHFRTPTGASYMCTIGGLVSVNGTVLGLTTAHAIWDSGLYTEQSTVTASDTARNLIYGSAVGLGPSRYDDTNPYWVSAALRAASYGVPSPPKMPDVITDVPIPSKCNRDFALLHIDFHNIDRGPLIPNVYWTSSGPQVIDGISRDLIGRDVHLVCASDNVRHGRLLEGESFILDDKGLWETRKIQLDSPLRKLVSYSNLAVSRPTEAFSQSLTDLAAPGSSGTWVVDNGTLLGIITAVYDDEPYAHMIPIASVFSGIESLLTVDSLRPIVKMVDRYQVSSVNVDNRSRTLTKAQSGKLLYESTPKARAEENPSEYPGRVTDRPADETSLGYPPPFGIVLLMWVMIILLAIDISAFPIIMPTITDTFNSIKLAGWYGSAYFLAFGLTYSTFAESYHLSVRLWNGRGALLLLSVCVVCFGAGGICSYLTSSGTGILIGRAITGAGSAGISSGTYFIYYVTYPNRFRGSDATVMIIHAVVRFIGPLIAAAMTDRLQTTKSWRAVILLNLVITAVAFVITLVCVFRHAKYIKAQDSAYPISKPRFESVRRIPDMLQRVGIMCCLGGAIVCLLLALHYGALRSWHNAMVISLFTAGVGGCGLLLLAGCLTRNYRDRASNWISNFPWRKESLEVILDTLWGASFHSFTYLFPTWLQTVHMYSPLKTGTMYLPLAATHLFACVFALIAMRLDEGWSTRRCSILAASLGFMALFTGLSSRFTVSTSSFSVIWLQIIFSIGAGLGTCEPLRLGKHLVRFRRIISAQCLGGSIAIGTAHAVLLTQLTDATRDTDPDLLLITSGGFNNFKDKLSSDALGVALGIFNKALTRTFFVATAAGALPFGIVVLMATPAIPMVLGFSWWKRKRSKKAKRPALIEEKKIDPKPLRVSELTGYEPLPQLHTKDRNSLSISRGPMELPEVSPYALGKSKPAGYAAV